MNAKTKKNEERLFLVLWMWKQEKKPSKPKEKIKIENLRENYTKKENIQDKSFSVTWDTKWWELL